MICLEISYFEKKICSSIFFLMSPCLFLRSAMFAKVSLRLDSLKIDSQWRERCLKESKPITQEFKILILKRIRGKKVYLNQRNLLMQKVFFFEEFSLDLSDSTMCILTVNRQILFPILLCSSYREFVVASLTVSSCSWFHFMGVHFPLYFYQQAVVRQL